jgi:hypothetical protein
MHFLAPKKYVKSTDVLRVHHCRCLKRTRGYGGNAEIKFGASRGGWVEACWDAQAFQGDAAVWYSVCARVCVQCACVCVRTTGREIPGLGSHTCCAHFIVGMRGVARYVCACSGVVRCVRVCAARRCSTPSNGAAVDMHRASTHVLSSPPMPLPHSHTQVARRHGWLAVNVLTSTSRADALRDAATRVTHELGAVVDPGRPLASLPRIGRWAHPIRCAAAVSRARQTTASVTPSRPKALGGTRLVASYGVHAP